MNPSLQVPIVPPAANGISGFPAMSAGLPITAAATASMTAPPMPLPGMELIPGFSPLASYSVPTVTPSLLPAFLPLAPTPWLAPPALSTGLPGVVPFAAHLYHHHFAPAALPVGYPNMPMPQFSPFGSYLPMPTTMSAEPASQAAQPTTGSPAVEPSTAGSVAPSKSARTNGNATSSSNYGINSSSTDSKSGTPVTAAELHGRGFEPRPFDVSCSNRAILENRQLVVKFLTDETNDKQFREIFEVFGPVENARIIYDRKTNHTKGFGFITYKHAKHAVQALRNMGGYELHGRQLNVALAQTERKRAFAAQEFVAPSPGKPSDTSSDSAAASVTPTSANDREPKSASSNEP